MTEKVFRQSFRRGLGSAIIEIINSDDKSKYRDIVEYYCLRDITYDWQIEGTKGDYLYTVICELGEQEYFEDVIIKKFMSRCNCRLFSQLARVLYLLGNNGSQQAKDVFWRKYEYFKNKKGRLIKGNTDEAFQREEVVEYLFWLNGFSAFKEHIETVGNELLLNPNNERNVGDWDWFLHRAEEYFGKKRIKDYFDRESIKSDAVKALIDYFTVLEKNYKEHQKNRRMTIKTATDVLKLARESTKEQYPRAKMMYCRSWLIGHATASDIAELVSLIATEENETAKGLLLHMFGNPKTAKHLEVEPLLGYARSDNEILSESAIKCLEYRKDKRIHDLAIELLQTKGLDSTALGLLVKNYRKSDDMLINTLVTKLRTMPHHVQMDIDNIYRHNCSATALPILIHTYRLGDCSHCREYTVRAMNHCGVLSYEILQECLYDSYSDTRAYAKRVITARNHKIKK